MVDLHIHTTASDGTYRPQEVVHLAKERGLKAIAITDHDTMSGVAQAVLAGEHCGVEVVPGIEISAEHCGRRIHVLGYYLRAEAPSLRSVLSWAEQDRRRRNVEIIRRMQADGFAVSLEEVEAYTSGVVGRPHIAKLLVQKGYAGSEEDAFQKYLLRGAKYYVKRGLLTHKSAIAAIKEAGGKAVLAHPLLYGCEKNELEELVFNCKAVGLVGIETRYSAYGEASWDYLEKIARAHTLICTGGSDFHGTSKPDVRLGEPCVPDGYLEALKCAR